MRFPSRVPILFQIPWLNRNSPAHNLTCRVLFLAVRREIFSTPPCRSGVHAAALHRQSLTRPDQSRLYAHRRCRHPGASGNAGNISWRSRWQHVIAVDIGHHVAVAVGERMIEGLSLATVRCAAPAVTRMTAEGGSYAYRLCDYGSNREFKPSFGTVKVVSLPPEASFGRGELTLPNAARERSLLCI